VSVRWAYLGVALVVAAGAGFGPSARAAERPGAGAVDLSGQWSFNKQLSDDQQSKLPTSGERRHDLDSSGPGAGDAADGEEPGRGGGGAHGGGKAAPPVATVDDDPRGPRQAAEPGATLTITQTQAEIVVQEGPGQPRSLYPNGRTYKADDGASDIRSQWKDGALVVEKKNTRGWRLTETWRLAPDGKRLTLDWRLEGGSRPRVSLRRVYDRAEPGP
jgi:hypothetical protein